MDTPPPAAARCPRCSQPFHCGAREAAPCPCAGIATSARLRGELRTRYADCLCIACLSELAREDLAAVERHGARG